MINNTTSQLAGPNDDPGNTHQETRPVYTDPDGTMYCMNCPIASESAVIKYPLPQSEVTSSPSPSPVNN